jgi:hypothetical protein
MTDDRCKHDLLPGQCVDCRLPPRGLTKRVYRTAGGQVFHRNASCEALRLGQAKAARRQNNIHPAELLDVAEALQLGLGACQRCFIGYRGEVERPCWVRVGDRWLHGSLMHWSKGPTSWKGLVRYTLDGEVVVMVMDQTDLRKRDG